MTRVTFNWVQFVGVEQSLCNVWNKMGLVPFLGTKQFNTNSNTPSEDM